MNRRSLSLLPLYYLLAAALVAACSDPTPVPLTPEEIVSRSAIRMNGLAGFYFIIDRSGLPAYLDPGNTIAFRRAQGYYVAPDRAQASVRVIGPGLVTEVGVVSVGQTQWETNILTGDWRELPPNWGFNPAVLFDPQIGIQSILAVDLSDMVLAGHEKLDGGPDQSVYVVEGTLAGERLHEMSYGLIGPEVMSARLWIMPESFELIRALIIDPNEGHEEATVWQVDFSQFDKTVNIVPPET
jgi:lipoprotein LprG